MRFVDNPETAVLAAAKDMLRRGLVEGTAGNISARRSDGNIVITPSSVDYADMVLDDLVLVDRGRRRAARQGRPAPVLGGKLHLACYQAFDDIGSVIHSHPVWATMFAIAHQSIPACIDEFAVYCGGDVRCTEYAASRHSRRRHQRGQGAGGPGRGADRQPRPGGRRAPARQGPAHHRAGRAHRPNRLGCKGSRWTRADPRDVNRNFAGVYSYLRANPM